MAGSRARPGGALDEAFAFVARQVADEGAPAVVLVVADAGGTFRAQAFPARRDAVRVDSRFMIASITKPLLATAFLQLVEAGRLDLDRPVHADLPDFAPPAAPGGGPGGEAVTPRHILSHTSGLADLDTAEMVRERPSAARMLALVSSRPLAAPPGTVFRYASAPFYVLGALIRHASGQPYPAYLRRHVLAPLGMTATGFGVPLRGRARVHHFGPAGLRGTVFQVAFAQRAFAGGGLWSRADDLVRFGRALLREGELDGVRVLATESVREMTREQTAAVRDAVSGAEPHYALAWNRSGLDPALPGTPAAFDHGGATGGRLWIDPGAGLVVVYLMNDWTAERRWSIPAIGAVYRALGLKAGTGEGALRRGSS